MRQDPSLTLYHSPFCPYCWRVTRALSRLDVEIPQVATTLNPKAREELRAATGRETVPVLRIEEPDGTVRWMPESLDIIAFLEARFA